MRRSSVHLLSSAFTHDPLLIPPTLPNVPRARSSFIYLLQSAFDGSPPFTVPVQTSSPAREKFCSSRLIPACSSPFPNASLSSATRAPSRRRNGGPFAFRRAPAANVLPEDELR